MLAKIETTLPKVEMISKEFIERIVDCIIFSTGENGDPPKEYKEDQFRKDLFKAMYPGQKMKRSNKSKSKMSKKEKRREDESRKKAKASLKEFERLAKPIYKLILEFIGLFAISFYFFNCLENTAKFIDKDIPLKVNKKRDRIFSVDAIKKLLPLWIKMYHFLCDFDGMFKVHFDAYYEIGKKGNAIQHPIPQFKATPMRLSINNTVLQNIFQDKKVTLDQLYGLPKNIMQRHYGGKRFNAGYVQTIKSDGRGAACIIINTHKDDKRPG